MVDGNGKNKKIVKILVGIPKNGDTDPEAYDNRLEMTTHMGTLQAMSSVGIKEYGGLKLDIPNGVEYQFFIATIGDAFIAYAREQMANIAVDNDFDYLFMIDDDMLGPADIFERLIRHDVDICGALAFTRFAPHKPVIYILDEGYDSLVNHHYYANYSVERYPKNQLVECDAVGFGAVLIKVSVMKSMRNEGKPLMMSTTGSGEDIFFCHNARKAGFRVFSDTSTQLAHLGSRKKITEYTYENHNEVDKDREEKGDTDKYGVQFGSIRFADRPESDTVEKE